MIADLDLNQMSQPKLHRILVVDDVPENLSLLSAMLGQEGYEVRRAPNGTMALQNVPRYRPHLILLDIMMPGLNGYEVCKILKEDEDTSQIPIIFLSALNESFDKVKPFKTGGSDYITKPFDVDEVLARVKQQLDLQDLRLALEIQNQKLKEEVEERSRAEEKAFQASQAKSQFLAHMSHELRTPLSTIVGYADLMLSDPDRSSQDCRNLRTILNSTSHLLSLIEDVLNMTKIESGRVNIYSKVFCFQEFLSGLEEMFRIQAEVKDIKFALHSPEPLPPYIETDEIKLRQVLINLVSNALKFTVKGSVTLSTKAWFSNDRLGAKSTGYCLLEFQVQDTGPGILPEEQSSLFQPFSQTQTGRSSQTVSGLGLAISRNFIRLMGGDIFVDSIPQQGTCFTVQVLVKCLDCCQVLPDSKPEVNANSNSNSNPNSNVNCSCNANPSPVLSPGHRILLLLHTLDLQHWLPQCLLKLGWEVKSIEATPEFYSEPFSAEFYSDLNPTLNSNWNPDLILVEWEEESPLGKIIEHFRPEIKNLPTEAQSVPSKQPLIITIVPDSLVKKAPDAPEILEQGWDRVLMPLHHPHPILEQLSQLIP